MKRKRSKPLERVGLGDRIEHLPSQLSGGEQQRVAVARALINHPKLILADEPTGNLDEANEKIVLDLLRELHAERRTILMVTHAPTIGSLADRRIDFSHGHLDSCSRLAQLAWANDPESCRACKVRGP